MDQSFSAFSGTEDLSDEEVPTPISSPDLPLNSKQSSSPPKAISPQRSAALHNRLYSDAKTITEKRKMQKEQNDKIEEMKLKSQSVEAKAKLRKDKEKDKSGKSADTYESQSSVFDKLAEDAKRRQELRDKEEKKQKIESLAVSSDDALLASSSPAPATSPSKHNKQDSEVEQERQRLIQQQRRKQERMKGGLTTKEVDLVARLTMPKQDPKESTQEKSIDRSVYTFIPQVDHTSEFRRRIDGDNRSPSQKQQPGKHDSVDENQESPKQQTQIVEQDRVVLNPDEAASRLYADSKARKERQEQRKHVVEKEENYFRPNLKDTEKQNQKFENKNQSTDPDDTASSTSLNRPMSRSDRLFADHIRRQQKQELIKKLSTRSQTGDDGSSSASFEEAKSPYPHARTTVPGNNDTEDDHWTPPVKTEAELKELTIRLANEKIGKEEPDEVNEEIEWHNERQRKKRQGIVAEAMKKRIDTIFVELVKICDEKGDKKNTVKKSDHHDTQQKDEIQQLEDLDQTQNKDSPGQSLSPPAISQELEESDLTKPDSDPQPTTESPPEDPQPSVEDGPIQPENKPEEPQKEVSPAKLEPVPINTEAVGAEAATPTTPAKKPKKKKAKKGRKPKDGSTALDTPEKPDQMTLEMATPTQETIGEDAEAATPITKETPKDDEQTEKEEAHKEIEAVVPEDDAHNNEPAPFEDHKPVEERPSSPANNISETQPTDPESAVQPISETQEQSLDCSLAHRILSSTKNSPFTKPVTRGLLIILSSPPFVDASMELAQFEEEMLKLIAKVMIGDLTFSVFCLHEELLQAEIDRIVNEANRTRQAELNERQKSPQTLVKSSVLMKTHKSKLVSAMNDDKLDVDDCVERLRIEGELTKRRRNELSKKIDQERTFSHSPELSPKTQKLASEKQKQWREGDAKKIEEKKLEALNARKQREEERKAQTSSFSLFKSPPKPKKKGYDGYLIVREQEQERQSQRNLENTLSQTTSVSEANQAQVEHARQTLKSHVTELLSLEQLEEMDPSFRAVYENLRRQEELLSF